MNAPARQNLYRKYRPQRFAELSGQEHISRTIQSAVAAERISHAYMFSGPRGTGKTSAARLLAKILNCTDLQKDARGLPDCCRNCHNCQRIEEMNFMDIIEIDAASNNSVEDIRQMREKVKYRPAEGRYKIYIIDEVHMLSGSAFNAFLKTLEEPPPNVLFVLATTDPQKVPATIISRCQCFDFHSVSRRTIQARLEEIVKLESAEGQFPVFEPAALSMIAECAEGGFRDALSLLDQISSSATGDNISLDQVLDMTRRLSYTTLKEIAAAIFAHDLGILVNKLNELYFRGYEPLTIGRDLLEYLRRCMILRIDPEAGQVLDLPAEQVVEMRTQVAGLTARYMIGAVTRVERALVSIRNSLQARVLLESELIRLGLGDEIFAAEALEKRVEVLEQKLAAVRRLAGNPAVSTARPQGRSITGPNTATPVVPARPTLVPAPSHKATHLPDNVVPMTTGRSLDPFGEFKNAVGTRSNVCQALLVNAKFQKPENGVMTFQLEQSFAAGKLKEEKNMALILEAARQVYGTVDSIRIVMAGSPGPGDGQPAQERPNHAEQIAKIDEQKRQKILQKPAVSDAVDVFGGEIIDVED
ncbi:MAG TPA: DNA polymerase III subunit gamma/tau [Candidatus Rifleibacterium sp.]|nr:DNA polymerase III subunit gamma/tau [Candidatus Rifleibacterium sp.]HPT45256.1 DNA polymerase III subunit gamma/tau [Candidatus Rifleibacterium sp.]